MKKLKLMWLCIVLWRSGVIISMDSDFFEQEYLKTGLLGSDLLHMIEDDEDPDSQLCNSLYSDAESEENSEDAIWYSGDELVFRRLEEISFSDFKEEKEIVIGDRKGNSYHVKGKSYKSLNRAAGVLKNTLEIVFSDKPSNFDTFLQDLGQSLLGSSFQKLTIIIKQGAQQFDAPRNYHRYQGPNTNEVSYVTFLDRKPLRLSFGRTSSLHNMSRKRNQRRTYQPKK